MSQELPPSHSEKRQDPKCSLCVNHMGKDAPRTLGHKGQCRFANCSCEKCKITLRRRKGTAIEQQQRRNPEKRPKFEDQDLMEPVIDAVKVRLENLVKKIYQLHNNQTMVISELEGLLDICTERIDEDLKAIQKPIEKSHDIDYNQNIFEPSNAAFVPQQNDHTSMFACDYQCLESYQVVPSEYTYIPGHTNDVHYSQYHPQLQ